MKYILEIHTICFRRIFVRESLSELRDIFNRHHQEVGVGASHCCKGDGNITIVGQDKPFAHFSYNGRFWDNENNQEIKIEEEN